MIFLAPALNFTAQSKSLIRHLVCRVFAEGQHAALLSWRGNHRCFQYALGRKNRIELNTVPLSTRRCKMSSLACDNENHESSRKVVEEFNPGFSSSQLLFLKDNEIHNITPEIFLWELGYLIFSYLVSWRCIKPYLWIALLPPLLL